MYPWWPGGEVELVVCVAHIATRKKGKLMFDARLRPLIDPPLSRIGALLAGVGVSANMLTFAGLALGLSGAVAIAFTHYWLGLACIIANRLLDGLDGAVARVRGPTALGGYFDIVGDFAFYVSIPLAFGIAQPDDVLAACMLVASFVLTGVSFLAFAAISAERGLTTDAHGKKSFFYSTGLAEGAETIAVFIAMCLFPAWFAIIAYAYAALCVLTVFQRSAMAIALFRD